MKPAFWILFIVIALGALGGLTWYTLERAPGPEAKTAISTPPADACAEHGIADCPFCDPSLIDTMGFCKGHGVPEALCSKCRKDIEPVFRALNDWCNGHDLPESQCEACNPGVLDKWSDYGANPAAGDPAAAELPITPSLELFAIEQSGLPRVQRQPALACSTEQTIVRLASPEVVSTVGLQVERVGQAPLRRSLEVLAEIDYDARRFVRISPRAPGFIAAVHAELGQTVQAGEPLAVIDSTVVGSAKSGLLQALERAELWEANAAQVEGLLDKQLTLQSAALEARAQLAESRIALQAAEQKLQNLGLDKAQISAVRKDRDTASRLDVVAPIAGTIVELSAVLGERADESTPMVSVADTSSMWALLDVPVGEARHVRIGQPVMLNLDGLEDQTLGGEITWISTSVDVRTRTIKVRAEFANSGGQLRAGSFGKARIVTRDDSGAVLVPKSAVQWEGCCNVAFVRRSATEFVPRKLMLGYDAGDHFEVLSGLSAGEDVVTVGSFLLKTELMRGSIGAGCCEVEGLGE